MSSNFPNLMKKKDKGRDYDIKIKKRMLSKKYIYTNLNNFFNKYNYGFSFNKTPEE